MRLPPEFALLGGTLAVREGFAEEAGAWLAEVAPPEGAGPGSQAVRQPSGDGSRATRLLTGRGSSRIVGLRDGGRAYVKHYRHGGWLAGCFGGVYWQRPPRPWRELVATEAARRAGVLVPEVLAAAVLPVGWTLGVLYRGVLVTRELVGRRTLAAALEQAPSPGERRAWIAAAWETIRRLHRAGVRHPDLNAGNFLVASRVEEPIAVLDFDRAAARPAPVGGIGRALARRRLARSVAKLGLSGFDRESTRAMLRAAAGDGG